MTLLNHFIFAIFAQLSSVELMSGIKELELLLSNMEPVLDERDFVFCSFPTLDWDQMRELNPIGIFHEKEGVTFILDTKNAVDLSLSMYIQVWMRWG